MINWSWTDINPNTKKAERFIDSYNRSNYYRLEDAYKKPSHRKASIYKSLIIDMDNLGGFDMKITGANCSTFCCAFKYSDSGKDYLAYITPSYNYRILMNE